MIVEKYVRVIGVVMAVVLLLVGAVRAGVPSSAHQAHHGRLHIADQTDADAHAAQHCHDATGAYCCNAMTCCAVLQTTTMLNTATISHDFTLLMPQQFSSTLFVPRLPPRVA